MIFLMLSVETTVVKSPVSDIYFVLVFVLGLNNILDYHNTEKYSIIGNTVVTSDTRPLSGQLSHFRQFVGQ